jgi:hypothetical protein
VLDSQFGQATAIENDTGQMPHDKQFRLDQIGSRKSFSSLAEIEAEPLTRLKASLAWLVFKSAANPSAGTASGRSRISISVWFSPTTPLC